MALTCLQIIQSACKRIGILSPNAAVTATDQQIIQLVALAEEEGQELATRHDWQSLQTEATFTTVATQVQASLSTIAPGFDYIVNETIWNRTLRRPVYGPRSQQDWQQAKASQINGPFNSFRIIADKINFYPNPVAGQLCYFEFMSRAWVNVLSGPGAGTTAETWGSDADTTRIDGQLIVLGVVWRWKAAKGLDYAEDFAKYERRVADAMGRDAGKPVLNMTGCSTYDIQPVIAVPRGSWGI